MDIASSPRTVYRHAVMALAGFVLAAATVVLIVGWGLDVSLVRSVIPGAVGMKAGTAFGLMAASTAILLLTPTAGVIRHSTGMALAAFTGLLGAAVLAEYIFGLHLGIDEFPFVDHAGRAAGIAYPGRFAPTTAICFVLLSAALLCLDGETPSRWRPVEALAIPVSVLAFMSIVGYAYAIPAFYGPASAAKMAANTAACLILLALATVLARPRTQLVSLATTTDPGGVMVRRVVPFCIVGPLVLGWLFLRGVGWEIFNAQVGAWWLAAFTVGGLVLMMWWCANNLSRTDKERRKLESALFDLANRDQLTGLLSRHRFEEEVEEFLTRGRRSGEHATLLMFDLDGLKPVNDSLGHQAGDALLCSVADTAVGRLRESDVLGRLGGDEFAALLMNAEGDAAVQVAEQLVAAISASHVAALEGRVSTTVSIGLAAVCPEDEHSVSEFLRRADQAMYLAKRGGGDRVSTWVAVAPVTDAA